MKKLLLTLLVALGGLAIATNASTIKTWTNETLRYTDLNANFQHIHNTMVGGHGARLVDADVSASAAIAHSKLATPALVAKSVTSMITACTVNGACTLTGTVGIISSVTRTGTGVYTLAFTSARPNATFYPFVMGVSTISDICTGTNYTTSGFTIRCFTHAGVASDSMYTILVFDDND